LLPPKYGACASAVPGYNIKILDDRGEEMRRGELGNMVIELPLPPGTLLTLHNDEPRCHAEYFARFPGHYETGDAAIIDEDGYIHILGRTDDVINTAGHRLSPGAMEEVLMEHAEVADCAVIPVKDALKGTVPAGFVVLNAGSTVDHGVLRDELRGMVRESLGPVAAFRKVAVVARLPKTRSGKVLRGTMSRIANGEAWTITPTIEDPKVFDYLVPEIEKLMRDD